MNKLSKVSLVAILAVVFTLCLGGSVSAASPARVYLDAADSFAVLSGESVTNTGNSVINGNLGVYAGSSVTGFPPGVLNGTQHVNDTAAISAKDALTAAYLNAANRPADLDLGVTDNQLGGKTLPPGVYTFGNAATANLIGTLTLDGTGYADPIWIFQATSDLVTQSGTTPRSIVSLINATPCDVFWQVTSTATLKTDTQFKGNIMALTSINLNTRATLDGSALARNGAVTLDTNTITKGPCPLSPTTVPYTGGVASNGKSSPWNIAVLAVVILAGISIISILFMVARRKKVTS